MNMNVQKVENTFWDRYLININPLVVMLERLLIKQFIRTLQWEM
uniref:Uncharacterized protein n=1 Tax=Meloidogyne enterolobii TaxID=390850 RepID=A0A6V7UD16_MELEN|nr:unnamed protein product [Meloidogyne enterolobii]